MTPDASLIFAHATEYRQGDVISTPKQYGERVERRGRSGPGTSPDTKFILNLLRQAEAFGDDLPYHGTVGEYADKIPAGNVEAGVDYYNSNSFTSGILGAAGVEDVPDPFGYQPGLDKPIPSPISE